MLNQEDILAVVQQWPAEWMKDAGTRPNILVSPITDVGTGPSHPQQNNPLEESEEQDESQQSEGDHGGDDGADEEEEESVNTISDPNRPDKRKSPKVEEVTKPQPKKKTKASKGKNIIEEPALTIDELDQALTKSTEVLSNKWVEFKAKHLDVFTGITQRIAELKSLLERTTTGATASSAPIGMQLDTRQWPSRNN